MNALDTLKAKLNKIVALEQSESIETLGSYIVGELLGDPDGIYGELNETNQTVQRIGDLAGDLEISNGSDEQLQNMWNEIKELVTVLDANQNNSPRQS